MKPIVRFDFLAGGREAEMVIERSIARGYRPVFVIDQKNEGAQYREALRGTSYEHLDWPARSIARRPGSSTLLYVDAADGDRPRDRIPPMDLLK